MSLSDAVATKRFFTVDEANKMLPLVRPIVEDIVKQFRLVAELKTRIDAVSERSTPRRQADPYLEEMTQTFQEYEREQAKLSEFVEELLKLGIELKGVDGLCDFPSVIDGREVYLCWRLGEATVGYWHELDAGFAGRQPLPIARSDAHPSALN
jgi:hypothetical protein